MKAINQVTHLNTFIGPAFLQNEIIQMICLYSYREVLNDSRDLFTHILQCCFSDTMAIIRLATVGEDVHNLARLKYLAYTSAQNYISFTDGFSKYFGLHIKN